MRSLLFVPGDSEKKLDRALQAGADVLLLDLEDSVAAERKEAARRIVSGFLAARRADRAAAFYVRINHLGSGLVDADLAAVMPARPAGILLPKACGGPDIEQLAAKLRVHEAENEVGDGTTRILALMAETAAGILGAATYRPPHPRLAGLTWGAEDLSADIGARSARGAEGHYTDVFRLARTLTLVAAAAAEVAAIDTVFVNFRDLAGLETECREAEREGFTAKLAIHPAQVPVINAAFTPSPEAVAEARAVVGAFVAAGNPGVLGIGGKMYDRPHLRRAERLLARAAAIVRS